MAIKKHKEVLNAKHSSHAKGGAGAFAKKYPGFTFALIVALIVIISYAFFSGGAGYFSSSEENAYAKQVSEDNRAALEEYLANIAAELDGRYDTTIEDDYLYSMKDDVEWLKTKEAALYSAMPVSQAFMREFAFTIFMQKVVEVNQNSSIEIGAQDYSERISYAQTLEIKAPELLTEEDLSEIAFEPGEKDVFDAVTKALFYEYIAAKKSILSGDSALERKYVEAKKLIYLSYSGSP